MRGGYRALRAPRPGEPLTEVQAVASTDLFADDVGVLLLMRDHPGHWICLSCNAMGDGPVGVAKKVWHSRLVGAADGHRAFWARLSETTPPENW